MTEVILVEDRAVRTSIRLAFLAVCLGLAGCSLFGKKQASEGGTGRPFLGSGSASSSASRSSGGGTADIAAAPDPNAPLPGANGLLAGQVLDRFNRRPPKAYIQVVDLQETKAQPSAKLEVESQQDGYFVIQSLQLGRHYRLIARSKDGEKTLTGTTVAMPPNPRLTIYLSEENTTPETPAVPGPPTVPGRTPSGGNADAGAALDPPEKTKPGETPRSKPGDGGTPSSPTGGGATSLPAINVPVNPAQIAQQGDVRDGFQRGPPSPVINMPSPPPPGPLPPAPQVPGGSLAEPALPAHPQSRSDGPPVPLPNVPTPVPSCVVVGRRVDNFALYDLDGQPWEFRRHRVGKLVLLDFWYSSCPACLQSMPHLVDLQRRYSQFGLEVVGIAYEQGTPQEQAMKARRVRARYGISYTTLLSGGPHCPVKWQMRVQVFPTLILLDEKGEIVWHSEKNGLDEDTLRDLETELHRRLAIR